MLNQLLKFTLVSSALLWLRPRWRGLLALIVFVIMVHVLHGEYLGYVELSGERDFLVASFVIKWVALICGMLAYFLLAIRGLGKPAVQQQAAKGAAGKARAAETLREAAGANDRADDGFDFLRKKKNLDSKADKIIQRKR
jgi:hypothetical protein